ncbi:putative peptidyl-prolyl cis-trans isomerase E [Cardiosporidium cionae]|uniref:Peptidyl-prolyl cis-trans isomerase E n=1 Tax=Cardiosporidium cionae TaxID=476202 RepID=A0ABQ7J464_9APIC|nr:putative peptidyl-prolyl cis-trans isomerase E [Cardiosporidium cionae]|eukprot:KAF8817826.1 putative peptidyl-prolyl cis-trans isomerase E [Cardiosporidium cionae]
MNSSDAHLSRTLFVGSLAEEVTPDILTAAFIPFGPLKHVEIPVDRVKGTFIEKMEWLVILKWRFPYVDTNVASVVFCLLHAQIVAFVGTHRGFGFVEFEEDGDALHAIENMHNSELYGRTIRVNLAKTTSRFPATPNKPIWADDFFYRQQLASEGMDVDTTVLDSIDLMEGSKNDGSDLLKQ